MKSIAGVFETGLLCSSQEGSDMILIKPAGKVEFIFDHSSVEPVYLVGDFNQWDEKSHPMILENGKWRLELELAPGEYEFKYLVGKLWYNDYAAHKYVSNPWGSENSVLVIKSR